MTFPLLLQEMKKDLVNKLEFYPINLLPSCGQCFHGNEIKIKAMFNYLNIQLISLAILFQP